MIEFLRHFNELGVGASIVQKKELSSHELSSIFWFAVLLSFAVYAVAFGTAPLAEWFFHTPGLSRVFRVLALTFIIAGLKTVPMTLAIRSVEFKAISIVEALSFFASGTTSITLAYLGCGVWALVFGALAYDLAYTCMVFFAQPWRPRVELDLSQVRGMLRFGLTVTGARLLFNIYQEADNFVVSRVMGAIPLGYYSMSFRLARLPVEKISAVVNNIAFPVFSRVQDDLERLSSYYLSVARLIALLTFPLMVGGIVLAHDLIDVILTRKWAPSILAFQILSTSAILQSVATINGHLLNARGKVGHTFRYQLLAVIVLPTAFLVGVRKGINGVALGWLTVEPLLMIYMFRMVFSEIGVTVGRYLRALGPALVGSGGMALSVLAVRHLALPPLLDDRHASLRLGACIAAGAISYLGILVTFFRDTVHGIRATLRPPRA
jgi:O-antigen/teichoic acid export membrane protein